MPLKTNEKFVFPTLNSYVLGGWRRFLGSVNGGFLKHNWFPCHGKPMGSNENLFYMSRYKRYMIRKICICNLHV